MKNIKTFKITCNQCQQSDVIAIDDQHNIYWKPVKNIISGRYRLDMNFGWQCLCGNNDIVTKQEEKEIENLQAPDPQDIGRVLENLVPDKPRFQMEAI